MPGTIRYCIQCGRDIGDAAACMAPGCDGLPSFYRHVPGPESQRRIERSGPPAAAPAHLSTLGISPDPRERPGPAAPPPERYTLAIDTAPVAFLRAVASPGREEAIFPGAIEVGARPPAKLVIDRPEVSSRHARLECRLGEEGEWEITVSDLGSTNGTFVNGERIQSRRLAAGDRVRFAKVEYELVLPPSEEPRMTMPL
jgi:hypothetical protein